MTNRFDDLRRDLDAAASDRTGRRLFGAATPDNAVSALRTSTAIGVDANALVQDPATLQQLERNVSDSEALRDAPQVRRFIDQSEINAALVSDEPAALSGFERMQRWLSDGSQELFGWNRDDRFQSGFGLAIEGATKIGVSAVSTVRGMAAASRAVEAVEALQTMQTIMSGETPTGDQLNSQGFLRNSISVDPESGGAISFQDATPDQQASIMDRVAEQFMGADTDVTEAALMVALMTQQNPQGPTLSLDNIPAIIGFYGVQSTALALPALSAGLIGGRQLGMALLLGQGLGQGFAEATRSDILEDGPEAFYSEDTMTKGLLVAPLFAALDVLGPVGRVLRRPFADIPEDLILRALRARTLPRQIGAVVAGGALEEGIAEMGQEMLVDWGNGELDWTTEGITGYLEAAAIGALVGGPMTAAFEAPALIVQTRRNRDAQSDGVTNNVLQRIQDQAGSIRLRERSPEKWREFLQAIGTDQGRMYIEGDALQAAVTAGTVEAGLLGVTPEQIQTAIDTGGRVQISQTDWAANYAGTEVGQTVLENSAARADGYTPAQLRNFEDLVAQTDAESTFTTEQTAELDRRTDVLRNERRLQMRAGGMSQAEASVNASLQANAMRALATRNNDITILDQFELDILGVSTLGRQRAADAVARVLDQPAETAARSAAIEEQTSQVQTLEGTVAQLEADVAAAAPEARAALEVQLQDTVAQLATAGASLNELTEAADAGTAQPRETPTTGEGNGQRSDTGGRTRSGGLSALEGAPTVRGVSGPDPRLVAVAEQYAADNGIDLKRQSTFTGVDPEFATRVADAYETMEHNPQDPTVKEAYANLIQQTTAQYEALVAAGYQFYFIDLSTQAGQDYAASPWNAMFDTRDNQTMGVFSTAEGFGTSADFNADANPMLTPTTVEWPLGPDGERRPVYANDLFRAVHDAFGHGLEFAGFRAVGEENAWQAHQRLFTGSAVAAITTETRGQNSWLNYGPNGEANRTASVEDTVFADQKTGLLPEFAWTENVSPDDTGDVAQDDGFRVMYQSENRRTPSTQGEVTGVEMPTSLAAASQVALDEQFATGRDFKIDLQERARAVHGDSLMALNDENMAKIADFIFEDAMEAVQDNGNAIGWYDAAMSRAKTALAEIYPEIAQGGEAEFVFIFALAVTSNGLKVNANFKLAAQAYDVWKETGAFPAKIGTGTAAGQIDGGLQMYAALVKKFGGWEAARDFMVSQQKVSDIEAASGMEVSGEGKAAIVRGAAVIGPKIGNGFFSNLYGYFDGLTMDRWLMRSVGRWRGSLLSINAEMITKKLGEMKAVMAALDTKSANAFKRHVRDGLSGPQQAIFDGIKIGRRMSSTDMQTFGLLIQKASVSPAWRTKGNAMRGGSDMRKLGNALTKYLDGQVEAPAGPAERAFLRGAFKQALGALQQQDGMEALTMADLQALLWYPEKLLYDSAKKPSGEEIKSYADDEAPDYGNAAEALVRDRLGRDRDAGAGGRVGEQPSPAGAELGASGRTLNQASVGPNELVKQPFGSYTLERHSADKYRVMYRGLEVGYMVMEDQNGNRAVSGMAVNKAHRRKGVMTALHDFARSIDGPITPSRNLLDDGLNFYSGYDPQQLVGRAEFDLKSQIGETVTHQGEEFVLHAASGAIAVLKMSNGQTKTVMATDISFPQRTLNQEGARGQINLPENVRTGTSLIQLFKSSDPSTMAHEFSHYLIEVMRSLGERNGAPQQITDDLATVHAWMEETTGVAVDGNYTTAQQEAWAEAFENYLMSGVAPSPSLKVVFRKFALWLATVYKTAVGAGTQPSPEIREVMDRLLATDQEIAAVQLENNDGAMFGDKPPFMSADEWETYRKVAERGDAEAQGKMLNRAMESVRKKQTKEWKAFYAEALVAATEDLSNEREYVLIAALGDKDNDFGRGARLDRDTLVSMFGTAILDDLKALKAPQLIYVKDGADIDQVADMFGFRNGAHMVQTLRTVKPLAEQAAANARAVADTQAPALTPAEMQEEAEASLKNPTRIERVAREGAALSKASGGVISSWTVMNRAAKARAERLVGEMNVRQAGNYRQFAVAARKAAREAQAQLSKVVRLADGTPTAGGVPAMRKAADAKRQQLLNDHMYNTARERAKAFDKARRRFAKTDTKKGRAKVDPDYMDQADALLSQYDFRQRTTAQIAENTTARKSLAAFILQQQEAGVDGELAIAPQVLLRGNAPLNYTELTVDELEAVVDAVDNLVHAGKAVQKSYLENTTLMYGEMVSEITTNMSVKMKATPRSDRESGQRSAVPKFLGALNHNIETALTTIRRMDGWEDNGPAMRFIFRPLQRAAAAVEERREQETVALKELYNRHYTTKEIRQLNDKRKNGIYIPELGNTFSKAGLLSMALNSGNEGNFQRLTDVEGVTGDGAYDASRVNFALTEHMTETDWRFVQDMWDHIGSFWPEISALEREVSGVVPKQVDSIVQVDAPDFVTGGYYPISYDADRNIASFLSGADDAYKDATGGRSGKAQTRSGHVEARLRSTGMALDLNLGVAENHIMKVVHDLAMRKPINHAVKMLNNPAIGQALEEFGRTSDLQSLRSWLVDSAAGDSISADSMGGVMRYARKALTVKYIGFSLATLTLQPLGAVQAGVVVGNRALASAYVKYAGRAQYWNNFIQTNSAHMRLRVRAVNREMNEFSREARTAETAGAGALTRWSNAVTSASLAPIGHVQYWTVDIPVFIAAFEKARGEGVAEADAISLAENAVDRASGSGSFLNRASFERGTSSDSARRTEYIKTFTMLASYVHSKYNAYVEVKGRTDFSSPLDTIKFTFSMMQLFVWEAAIVALYRSMGEERDEEEGTGKWLASIVGAEVLGLHPVTRPLSSYVSGYGTGTVPLGDFAEILAQGGSGAVDIATGVGDINDWLRTFDAAATPFMLPTGQMKKIIRAITADEPAAQLGRVAMGLTPLRE